MLKGKELAHILLVLIILIFAVNLNNVILNNLTPEIFLIKSVGITIIVFASIFSIKAASHYFESEAEFKIWQWERYGFKRQYKLKKSIPAGIIIPFLISFLSAGYFLWLAALEFDVKTHPSRASKRHDFWKFTDMTDIHLGLIASAGIISSLIISIIAYLTNFPEISKLAVYYAAWSLAPISNLDGAKIFFATKGMKLWITLAIIVLIFLAYALFLP